MLAKPWSNRESVVALIKRQGNRRKVKEQTWRCQGRLEITGFLATKRQVKLQELYSGKQRDRQLRLVPSFEQHFHQMHENKDTNQQILGLFSH
jgi:hypothetical protein